jgi:uncharacterized protein with PIN domain
MFTKTRTQKNEAHASAQPKAAVDLRVGPDRRGPQRCLKCRQLFKPGESWKRMTSPPDPTFGSYSIGIHERCEQHK